MKIIFVTDLHGMQWKYDRLLGAAKEFDAEMLINGGDMLPKDIDLFEQDKFISGYLDHHFMQFDSAGIQYLCYPGNDDLKIFDQIFEKTCNKYPSVTNLAQRKVEIGEYEFIGMNWVVDYPFRLKDRCRMDTDDYVFQKQLGSGLLSAPNGWKEIDDWFAYAKNLPTIEEELERLPRPKDMSKSIYVIHMPPAGLGLDMIHQGISVGSKAIYDFIKNHQPKLTLHGHIHESPGVSDRWFAELGKTICIQPGQLNDLTYVTIDLSTMKYERIKEQRRV
ncbi:MAG: metallophosphoesterase [Pseudomonadota bacterium]